MMISFKPHHFYPLFLFILFIIGLVLDPSNAQTETQKNNTGFSCNKSSYPCEAYAFYSASSPNFLDLASIGDLFSVSRLMISKPSNISNSSSPLVPNQPLFVPLTCSCNTVNSTFGSISYANISYTIKPNDTYYLVSTFQFMNLTTFPSVEVVNPTHIATNLSIGDDVIFPVFCMCPNNRTTLLQERANYMISYVVQPSDNISSIASRFGSQEQSIIDVNGGKLTLYDTIFVPVTRLPVLSQPAVVPSSPPPAAAAGNGSSDDRTGTVRGLAIGLGITGLLLILVTGLWFYREVMFKDRVGMVRDEEQQRKKHNLHVGGKENKGNKHMDVMLMANVSDCLDKYRVFGIEELIEATDGFDQSCLIQGSVYKGSIDGEVFAIKKMKWNAYEELKILQKVNHGNLVKLEGFCIDPEEANCYLVYEYVENGSLYSWLHEDKNEKLNWKTRLRIAIDIANGLQYIHEHTRPRVVHKDIKSSNILLDSSMRAKIANFGLAKSGMNAITMHIVGTQGYIAPEYLADGVVSTKMDVFSFGVVLLELISGKEAIDEKGNLLWASAIKTFELNNEQEKARRLKEWMDKAILRDTCSMESLMGVLTIAIACFHKDPSKRPSIVDIVYALCKNEDTGFELSDEGIGSPRLVAR
ncbi:serine/threonine receptor-like kinase NFP [Gastrolobium bilobum]|uniref:serine/threonine receptor-like kinase NFP n=1 Tax=Gastrolobium bilobum TaxID=150636 RepID=UPI002AB0EC08|nr:serine/threonine receptor-like kinase NFP [Gastrolobium bilobum]